MLDTGPVWCIVVHMSTEMIVLVSIAIPSLVFLIGAYINDRMK